MKLINWDILKNPYNWAIVLSFLAFGAIILSVLMPAVSGE